MTPGERLHRTELCALLVESALDYAIFALDPEGTILTWNAGAEKLKGYAPDEIIGRHFSIFYPPQDIASRKPQRALATAMAEGRYQDEGWRIRKDGSQFWALVVITALRDGEGRLVGFGKVTRDLTEQRHAQELLRQSEERFRVLVHGVKDYAIFLMDPDGRVISWNDGAEAILGYREQEITGRHFSIFYPAADVANGKPVWELDIVAREGRHEEEGWRVRKDGTYFWSSVLITAIHGDDGRLIGFAKVSRDLTERRAAQERAINDARRIAEVESASRTKSEFLTSLSHELRTPINATLGYVDLLDVEVSGELNEAQREYLGRIRGSQEHLLRIITDLLQYSRIEAGHVRYELSPVSVTDVVATVLPMVEPQAAARDLTLDYQPCVPPPMARLDRAKTEQIVLNLLANAVKFTPAGGSIRISCVSQGGKVTLSVADTGPGVPLDQQAAIFEPFVQVGRSLTSGHEGTGLGLAISRDLARAMGGDVTVESVPGEGATFYFIAPAA